MKETLQEKIDTGEISSMAQLLSYVSNRSWKVTRNGANYMGIMNAAGKRFRVSFSFENDTRPARLKISHERRSEDRALFPGYWIYGLFVHDGMDRACYIGQAVNYLRRVKEHMRGREGRSSWDLFQWAETRKAAVQFALLEFIPGQPRTAKLAAEAAVLEGRWLYRARAANYLTPGSERWGTLPRPECEENFRWPADEIAAVCQPLSVVFTKQLLPAEVAIHSARATYEALAAHKD